MAQEEGPVLEEGEERHHFFLNPYDDCAFTRCPKCDGRTRQRKRPLVVFLLFPDMTRQILSLNKTCRYCPYCDLLIAHKREVVPMLAQFMGKDTLDEEDYFIAGTQDRAAWKANMRSADRPAARVEGFHVFKDVWRFTMEGGWAPREQEGAGEVTMS